MAKYIIKNNLPTETDRTPLVLNTAQAARKEFLRIVDQLSAKYQTKVFYRNVKSKPLRGQIQAEIDGFYYYVELYKEQQL